MPEDITIVRVLERLSADGYDLELITNNDSVRVGVISENPRIQVNRYIPFGCRPNELALIFWDISSTIKKLERKFSRVDRSRN
jgi:hypothetical protein